VIAEVIDQNVHIDEVCVHAHHARRGLGRCLRNTPASTARAFTAPH
jgi:hypothetical protein